jgi:hypothetical protein
VIYHSGDSLNQQHGELLTLCAKMVVKMSATAAAVAVTAAAVSAMAAVVVATAAATGDLGPQDWLRRKSEMTRTTTCGVI